MLGKIADRKDALLRGEASLAALDRARRSKEEELRALERKLVVLLEEQQRELEGIRGRQEKRSGSSSTSSSSLALTAAGANGGTTVGSGSGASQQQLQLVAAGGPSARDKRQAAQLMASTETLMKFGFMSMSMTYFSSLNMIRAMRAVGASDTVLGALAHNTAVRDGGSGGSSSSSAVAETAANAAVGAQPFRPALKPGESLGQQPLRVAAWSVGDVARWLQTLSLPQVQLPVHLFSLSAVVVCIQVLHHNRYR